MTKKRKMMKIHQQPNKKKYRATKKMNSAKKRKQLIKNDNKQRYFRARQCAKEEPGNLWI